MAGALKAPKMARHRAAAAHRHGGPTAVRAHGTSPLRPFDQPCPRARPPARGRRTRARRSKGSTELPFEVRAQPARGERDMACDCHDDSNGWGCVGWTQEHTPRSRAHSEVTKTRARAVLWWAAGVCFEAWSLRARRAAKCELRDHPDRWVYVAWTQQLLFMARAAASGRGKPQCAPRATSRLVNVPPPGEPARRDGSSNWRAPGC